MWGDGGRHPWGIDQRRGREVAEISSDDTHTNVSRTAYPYSDREHQHASYDDLEGR